MLTPASDIAFFYRTMHFKCKMPSHVGKKTNFTIH